MTSLQSLPHCVLGFLALAIFIQLHAFAQRMDVVIDHTYGTVTIIRPGQRDKVEPGKTHTITTSDTVSVTITKTNTALFDIQPSTERTPAATYTAVRTILEQSKPYLIDLGSAVLNSIGPVRVRLGYGAKTYPLTDSLDLLQQRLSEGLLPHAVSVSNLLQRLNVLLLYAPSSVRVIELKTMETLRHLDPTMREQFYRERDAFKDFLLSVHAFSDLSLSRSVTPDSLISCWEQLNAELGMLQTQVAMASNSQQNLLYTFQTGNPQSVRAQLRPSASNIDSLVRELKMVDPILAYGNKLISEAQRALDEKSANLRYAYEVEQISQQTARAECEMRIAEIRPDWKQDQTLHIKISQSEVAKRAGFPPQTDVEYVVQVQKEFPFRASVGVGLAGWFGPYFNDYMAVQLSQSQYQIVRKAPDFSRFRFVTTFSMLFRGLESREKDNIALWFPEITIGPLNDLEALGLGAGVAFWNIKIGVGSLWVKHVELDGQTENQYIPSASALRTRKTYGRFLYDPKFYLSLVVFDLPPFMITK